MPEVKLNDNPTDGGTGSENRLATEAIGENIQIILLMKTYVVYLCKCTLIQLYKLEVRPYFVEGC